MTKDEKEVCAAARRIRKRAATCEDKTECNDLVIAAEVLDHLSIAYLIAAQNRKATRMVEKLYTNCSGKEGAAWNHVLRLLEEDRRRRV